MEKTKPSFNYTYSRIFKSVIILLKITITLSVVAIISGYFEYQLLSDIDEGNFNQNTIDNSADANDTRQGIIGILQFILFIITAVYYCRWIYFANKNSRTIGANAMQFTPGWSVGWYFIPIACMWKPYQAMKEIWKTSKNSENWQSIETPALLRYWWMLWIASTLLGQLASRLSLRAEGIDELLFLSTLFIVSDIIEIFLCIVSINMITQIYNFQKNIITNNEN
tara:strand:+ start:745 stop:1416 length:672 start_codon:yes stop_codon:yes gene_type:complete